MGAALRCLLIGLIFVHPAWAETVGTVQEHQESVYDRVSARLDTRYQQLLISDDDPWDDRLILYRLGVQVELPVTGLSVGVSSGMTERFVAQPGESGVRAQDSSLSLNYAHSMATLSDRFAFDHRLKVWLPSSRFSLNQGLRLAPGIDSGIRYQVRPWLSVGLTLSGQYRWYAYAEQAGERSGMNTQWITGSSMRLTARLMRDPDWGQLTASLGGGSQWRRTYESREQFISDASDAALWTQSYGWNTAFEYTPMTWLRTGASVEHGGPLRRNGIVNPFFAHRDETRLSFHVALIY